MPDDRPETAIVTYDRPMQMAIENPGYARALLQSQRSRLIELKPDWCQPSFYERVVATAVEAVGGSAKLRRCSGTSILLSVKTAIEFGLSFSKPLGQAYLVPFKGQAILIIGYRGLLDLVRRAADVASIDCDVVYEGDFFEVIKGTAPQLTHRPNYELGNRVPEKLIATYAIAYYQNGHPQFDAMTKAEIDRIRAASPGASGDAWTYHYTQMARKTPIRRLCNYLPISTEKATLLERALEHDNRTAGIALREYDQPRLPDRSRTEEIAKELGVDPPPPDRVLDVDPVDGITLADCEEAFNVAAQEAGVPPSKTSAAFVELVKEVAGKAPAECEIPDLRKVIARINAGLDEAEGE